MKNEFNANEAMAQAASRVAARLAQCGNANASKAEKTANFLARLRNLSKIAV